MADNATFLQRLRRNKSGNATILMALGMPALIGAAGLGVDMAQLYMWKRELQHSADQGAIAAAWALAYDDDSTNYTKRAEQEFAANLNQVEDLVADDYKPAVSLAGYDGGVNNSVIVTAQASKKLPFSSYFMNKAYTVSVRAQASFEAGATYKACLLALKKGSSETFTIGGSATVDASCGLGALSCETDALTIGGSATVTTDSIATCGTASVPSSLDGKTAENVKTLSDAFGSLPPPASDADDEDAKTLSCKNGKTVSATPGRYTGGWDVKCSLTLASGIYIIDGGTMDLTSNKGSVLGTGVMFILRNGAQLKLGGSGNANKSTGELEFDDTDGASIQLTPLEAAYFEGGDNDAYKDQYAGLLFYEDRKDYSKDDGTTDWADLDELSGTVDHKINGNSRINMRGTFYLPRGDITLNGNSGASDNCFQLWAYTLKINGNTSLKTTCTSSATLTAGSSKLAVRLVA